MGRLADEVNQAKNSGRVFYINNLHINYSNICANRCRFCAYSRAGAEEEGAFFLSPGQVIRRAKELWHDKVCEFHIVGGCHPSAGLEYYRSILSGLSREFPGVHIQAFTAVEIENISRLENIPVGEVLETLVECGLGSLPGGGGEIFSPQVRGRICQEKISGELYLDLMRQAHSLGIPTNVTMLFGHIESCADRVDHMLAIRDIQDETGGFNSFIPLLFHPWNTKLEKINKTSGIDVLKTIAASRLILDNFSHIKSFWIMLGLPLTQMSLFFGSDDVNGTVVEERITHEAGAETPEHMPEERLVALIRQAGRIPVVRDTLYNIR